MTISFFFTNSYSQVNQQWVSTYNGTSNTFDKARSVAVDVNGNVYVTGSSSGTGTGVDYATVKYNSAGVQQWAARYNGEGARDDYANAIAADDEGNVYVTGWSNKSATGRDYATIKYNSSGDSVWVRRYSGLATSFNDEASSIAVDLTGNVYVTGYSVNGTNSDYATIKYNSAGVQQWVSRYDGPGAAYDNASSLAIDASGNVYVTGSSFATVTGGDFATIKYNSSGVQQWASRYSGMPINLSDFARDIAVDVSGNVYVTGESPASGTGSDYATIKYNSAGVQQWASRYAGPSSDVAFSLAVDVSGNVFVTGASLGSGTMNDYATVKYNSTGAEQWVRRYNGPEGNVTDNAYSLALDVYGNVYVTGESSGDGGDYFKYATVKYNTLGDSVWVKRFDGTGDGHDRAYSIAVDLNGNVYVTGESGAANDYATIKYSQYPNARITGFVQGFYNAASNNMISDTARVYIRNTVSPFAIIDSAKSKLNSLGTGLFSFPNAVNGTNYYIVLRHRNSIETWSSSGNSFTSDSLTYNFSTANSQSYGNNMKQVDSSPVRFGIYSGDADQNGFINLADIIKVSNDASNFIGGYAVTDMNGDSSVNLTDILITYNNAAAFVSVKRP
ncbi:MAG: SBBP repeat-containing protein [Ignavibacteria bacterium]